MLDAFLVFEGGGAKGLAHVGALKAAEERQVNPVGLGGASAGALIAALVAVGYSADELYDPDKPVGERGLIDVEFTNFVDRDAWKFTARLRKVLAMGKSSLWAHLLRFSLVLLLSLWHARTVARFFGRRGLTSSDRIVEFVDRCLNAKVTGSGANGRVLCADLPQLVIVASDMKDLGIKVFSGTDEKTADIPVAHAVAASVSIPLFFEPFCMNGDELVDGGVLSNFPTWVFDQQRAARGPTVPTFGFSLVQAGQTDPGRSVTGLVMRILTMLISGDPVLETREIENLHILPLRVSCTTFDFDLTKAERALLYAEGRESAERFFRESIGTQDPEEMTAVLRQLHNLVLAALRSVLDYDSDIHLRTNIIMPTNRQTLRVMYAYNMQTDADDRLEFTVGQGACSRCFQGAGAVLADLGDAREKLTAEWGMTKYQQALVRPPLKSLLAVPIFERGIRQQGRVIGVLNFDSDWDLLGAFGTPRVLMEAQEAAVIAAMALADRPLRMRRTSA